jgi:hypothetical protein
MRAKRYSAEQIVAKLREAEKLVGFINSIRLQIRRIGKRDRVFDTANRPRSRIGHLRWVQSWVQNPRVVTAQETERPAFAGLSE